MPEPTTILWTLYDVGHYVFLFLLSGIALRFLIDAIRS